MANRSKNIYVTKTTLPPIKGYIKYLRQIWKNNIVTNHGPIGGELESKLKKYLGVKYLHFVSNGTVAIEIAINALGLKGEIITTPFSYVATTSAILWTGLKPVYADIDEKTLCIDPGLIEKAITPNTSAILATHVFGNVCDINAIERIAKKHKIKIIYDAAHAFGINYKGKSIFSYGDISTVSFHATKLFHTAEGGAVITNSAKLSEKLFLSKAFGHQLDNHIMLGINGKSSELHAAMGLCNLPMVKGLISKRQKVYELYNSFLLNAGIIYPVMNKFSTRNFSYYPVIFPSHKIMLKVKKELEKTGIFPRRYFYPSINTLKYINGKCCPVSESIVQRILCLPFYDTLKAEDIRKISATIKKNIN